MIRFAEAPSTKQVAEPLMPKQRQEAEPAEPQTAERTTTKVSPARKKVT